MSFYLYLLLFALSALLLHRAYLLLTQTSSVITRSRRILSSADNTSSISSSSIDGSSLSVPVKDSLICDDDEKNDNNKSKLSNDGDSKSMFEHDQDSVPPPSPGLEGLVASQYTLTDLIRADISALPGAGYGSYVVLFTTK